jgi:uncharacterized protein (UPF0332 family)
MTPEEQIQYLMRQSKDDCELSRELSARHPNAAVSRAYYAMFHAAEAILLTKNMKFQKHSAVISAFNREFVKTGALPAPMTKWLQKGFIYRTQGDYGPVPVKTEAAEAIAESAAEFVETIREALLKDGFLKEQQDGE